MDLVKLPSSLIGSELPFGEGDMLLCDYVTRPPFPKNRVVLETNLLSFPLCGVKELYHFNSCYKTNGSNFVMVKSGHCIMSEKNADGDYFRSVVFFFSNSILQKILIKHSLINISGTQSEDAAIVLLYDKYITDFLETLVTLSHNTGQFSEQLKLIKLEEIILYLISRNGDQFLSFLNSNNFRPHELFLKSAVEKHVNERLSLEELAFLSNMSISTFKREFQKLYNSPPAKWFQNKRLENAAQMLRSQKVKPGMVYLDAGFESHSAFTKAFRQKFGLTPVEYQKR